MASKRKSKRRNALDRRAAKLMRALPPRGPREFPMPIGGVGQPAHVSTSPGWYGMCPVLYTKQHSLIVFIPYDLFATVRDVQRGGEPVELKFVPNAGDQELVTKLYEEA